MREPSSVPPQPTENAGSDAHKRVLPKVSVSQAEASRHNQNTENRESDADNEHLSLNLRVSCSLTFGWAKSIYHRKTIAIRRHQTSPLLLQARQEKRDGMNPQARGSLIGLPELRRTRRNMTSMLETIEGSLCLACMSCHRV